MTATTFYRLVTSPIGELLLTSDGTALTGLFLTRDGVPPVPQPGWQLDESLFDDAYQQLQAWFDGELQAFTLPLRPEGTVFQRQVWAELKCIPYGTTISYAELARRVGRPNAARAVGAANGSNPISLIIPCHRVIGADGRLVGYGGGLPNKRWLLEHEAAVLAGGAVPDYAGIRRERQVAR